VKLDDGFADHPKVAALDDRSFRSFVWILCYCGGQETDGYVDGAATRRCPAGARKDRLERTLGRLIDAGLLERDGDGFRVHDYLKYNPSRAQLEERRANDADRQRRSRENQEQPRQGVSHAVTENPVTGAPTRPDPKGSLSPRAVDVRRGERPRPEEEEELQPLDGSKKLAELFDKATPKGLP
jgi:hypothetical protein